MSMTPLVIVQCEPIAVDAKVAAALLGYQVSQFEKMVRDSGGALDPCELLTNGERRWSVEKLKRYVRIRDKVGNGGS